MFLDSCLPNVSCLLRVGAHTHVSSLDKNKLLDPQQDNTNGDPTAGATQKAHEQVFVLKFTLRGHSRAVSAIKYRCVEHAL